MGHAARYELKYLIQEPRAVAVADFVSSYLRPSEHNGSGPIRGFAVTLLVGIVSNLLTSVWMSRWMFDLIVGRRGSVAVTLSI